MEIHPSDQSDPNQIKPLPHTLQSHQVPSPTYSPHQNITNLTSNTIKSSENNPLSQQKHLEDASTRKNILCIFVIEDTKKIESIFQNLYSQVIQKIFHILREPVLISSSQTPTKITPCVRFGIVFYGDHPPLSNSATSSQYFTTNFRDFSDSLLTHSFSSTGNIRCAMLEGLVGALEMIDDFNEFDISASQSELHSTHCVLVGCTPPYGIESLSTSQNIGSNDPSNNMFNQRNNSFSIYGALEERCRENQRAEYDNFSFPNVLNKLKEKNIIFTSVTLPDIGHSTFKLITEKCSSDTSTSKDHLQLSSGFTIYSTAPELKSFEKYDDPTQKRIKLEHDITSPQEKSQIHIPMPPLAPAIDTSQTSDHILANSIATGIDMNNSGKTKSENIKSEPNIPSKLDKVKSADMETIASIPISIAATTSNTGRKSRGAKSSHKSSPRGGKSATRISSMSPALKNRSKNATSDTLKSEGIAKSPEEPLKHQQPLATTQQDISSTLPLSTNQDLNYPSIAATISDLVQKRSIFENEIKRLNQEYQEKMLHIQKYQQIENFQVPEMNNLNAAQRITAGMKASGQRQIRENECIQIMNMKKNHQQNIFAINNLLQQYQQDLSRIQQQNPAIPLTPQTTIVGSQQANNSLESPVFINKQMQVGDNSSSNNRMQASPVANTYLKTKDFANNIDQSFYKYIKVYNSNKIKHIPRFIHNLGQNQQQNDFNSSNILPMVSHAVNRLSQMTNKDHKTIASISITDLIKLVTLSNTADKIPSLTNEQRALINALSVYKNQLNSKNINANPNDFQSQIRTQSAQGKMPTSTSSESMRTPLDNHQAEINTPQTQPGLHRPSSVSGLQKQDQAQLKQRNLSFAWHGFIVSGSKISTGHQSELITAVQAAVVRNDNMNNVIANCVFERWPKRLSIAGFAYAKVSQMVDWATASEVPQVVFLRDSDLELRVGEASNASTNSNLSQVELSKSFDFLYATLKERSALALLKINESSHTNDNFGILIMCHNDSLIGFVFIKTPIPYEISSKFNSSTPAIINTIPQNDTNDLLVQNQRPGSSTSNIGSMGTSMNNIGLSIESPGPFQNSGLQNTLQGVNSSQSVASGALGTPQVSNSNINNQMTPISKSDSINTQNALSSNSLQFNSLLSPQRNGTMSGMNVATNTNMNSSQQQMGSTGGTPTLNPASVNGSSGSAAPGIANNTVNISSDILQNIIVSQENGINQNQQLLFQQQQFNPLQQNQIKLQLQQLQQNQNRQHQQLQMNQTQAQNQAQANGQALNQTQGQNQPQNQQQLQLHQQQQLQQLKLQAQADQNSANPQSSQSHLLQRLTDVFSGQGKSKQQAFQQAKVYMQNHIQSMSSQVQQAQAQAQAQNAAQALSNHLQLQSQNPNSNQGQNQLQSQMPTPIQQTQSQSSAQLQGQAQVQSQQQMQNMQRVHPSPLAALAQGNSIIDPVFLLASSGINLSQEQANQLRSMNPAQQSSSVQYLIQNMSNNNLAQQNFLMNASSMQQTGLNFNQNVMNKTPGMNQTPGIPNMGGTKSNVSVNMEGGMNIMSGGANTMFRSPGLVSAGDLGNINGLNVSNSNNNIFAQGLESVSNLSPEHIQLMRQYKLQQASNRQQNPQ
ncbi:hypothetical protein BB558_000288 [Smittium angustum]|uniref:Mediator of RNA polymerase II transcription subunit 25 n=1 Tax=Smittium angustum TaxID=133377 RepID=A0A2U1JEP5_SMIAN|nr:hypothetical protein BB558_000288 [Smittium angustum]